MYVYVNKELELEELELDMNLMQNYLYMGILDHQLFLGATVYHCHVHLVISRLSGSPVSRRSH